MLLGTGEMRNIYYDLQENLPAVLLTMPFRFQFFWSRRVIW